MSSYTVQIEASGSAGVWQALHPAETVEASTALEAAQITAMNQNIAEGDNWRVASWEGADADTGTRPDAIYAP